ncbi:peptide/nickel transport system substrate-binding protein [Mariprofundus aestuarium]|uniref:Peptide/nickel transport system substrate-binding protein n=1 Tax=Mariprofundus aestuarium TaxID=1921086 RepID=A0A2K8L6V9_MARES|nr:ABC transporter substrate-binding protein [Mariprofundus aestuarium]ATX79986.1 peptide/nickel transport system substrate-binding protein [Mariprofundus aestuarium]
MLILAGCQSADADRDLLRVGLAQMPITIDPRFATDAASVRVQDFLHRGLLKLDASFNVEGDLAESWEHPRPLLWRFRLRQGVTFSDGSQVTAGDVAATLRAVINPALVSPLKAGFAAIDHIDVDDDYSLSIHLSRADASLLSRLNLGILPASIAGAPHNAHQTNGCGAYKLALWNENGITLERREEAESVARIRFSSVKDPVTRVLKLTRGELDFVQNDLPPHLLPYIRDQKQLTVQTRPSTTFAYIGLNLQDKMLDDVRVRRALALALDREKLKSALFSDLPVLAETVLTTSHWASSQLPAVAFNLNEAERLLDAAGFPRGENGIRFTLNYRTSTDPTRLRLATAIAGMWEMAGIKVSIESLEWGGFYARIKRGDFQVFSLSWVGIADPDIYRWILHTEMWPPKGANRGRYSNPEVDGWLEAAAAGESQSERKALYARVQQQMLKDMVYIPLWYDPVIAVSGARIQGFEPMPDGNLRGLMNISFATEED